MDSQIFDGLAKIAMVLRHEAWASAGPAGITPTQGQILALLDARSSEPLRVADVARHLAITAATASDAVRVLAEKNLISKKPAANDGRAMTLKLSAKGRRLARQTAQWPDFLLAAASTLTESEQGALRKALIKMIQSLQQQGRIPLARMCSHCRYFQPFVHANRSQPHHCNYIDAPFGDAALRLDCGEFQAADEAQQAFAWNTFVQIEHGS